MHTSLPAEHHVVMSCEGHAKAFAENMLILQAGGSWGDETAAGGGWGPEPAGGSSRYEGSQGSSGSRRGSASHACQKEAAAASYMQSFAPPPASSIKVTPPPLHPHSHYSGHAGCTTCTVFSKQFLLILASLSISCIQKCTLQGRTTPKLYVDLASKSDEDKTTPCLGCQLCKPAAHIRCVLCHQ